MLLLILTFPFPQASSSVAGAVGMTTSGESESDDSEMGRLQGKDSYWVCTVLMITTGCIYSNSRYSCISRTKNMMLWVQRWPACILIFTVILLYLKNINNSTRVGFPLAPWSFVNSSHFLKMLWFFKTQSYVCFMCE